jgi:long-subunit fatty acid transport protein
MTGIRALAIAASIMLLVTMAAGAEIFEEVILLGGTASDQGARAAGLGGAFTAVADDYTASFWNPAGLGQIRRIELNGSIEQRNYRDKDLYFENQSDASSNFTKLSDFGMVFPVPTSRGSLVFSLGYNLVRNWDRITGFSDPQGLGRQYALWQQAEELENGRLGFWSFATAFDMSPNVSLGAALQYWIGRDSYSISGQMWNESGTATSEEQQVIDTGFNGWRGSVGVLFRGGKHIRIGAMILTPIEFNASEEYSATDYPSGQFDYRIAEPFRIRGGTSLSFGRILAAFDVDWMDWSQIQYRSEPPFPGYTKTTANIALRRDFRQTLGVHGGAEILLPVYGLKVRGGAGYDPSPEKGMGYEEAQKTIAGGLGFLVDQTVMLDLTYSSRWWHQRSDLLTEKIATRQLQFSIAYRF